MPPLQLSVADWCYYKPEYEPEAYYRRLRAAGYAAVEMADPSRFAAARAAGLRLLNVAGPGDLNRGELRGAKVAELRASIARAAAEGVEQVIVFSGNRDGRDDAAGERDCAATLGAVAGEAERAGVVLALEVFNRFDHPGYQADAGAYAFGVARAVGSPAVKVLYDLYHMHRMGEDVAAVVAANLPLIAHLHVAGSPGRDFPGDAQAVDYRAVVRRVMAAGYDGLWGMEFLPRADPLDELQRAADLFRGFGG